jgi:hypothetical protein
VSINSSQFLKSVSSGELERKSIEDGTQLQLDFSLFRDTDYDLYDIFDQSQSGEGLP